MSRTPLSMISIIARREAVCVTILDAFGSRDEVTRYDKRWGCQDDVGEEW